MTCSTACPGWLQARANLSTPFFAGIRPLLRELESDCWPTLEQLNNCAAARNIANALGRPIRFVPPVAEISSAMRYETQIAECGEVPTRDNWHDLFNALQWISFPRLKSAVNAQHARLLAGGGAAEATARSIPRDVLTMFDESGIIVASADESLLDLVRDFRWRALFVDRREDVLNRMQFVLVGHGLMEKSLAPFIGITAKAILLQVGTTSSLDGSAARWLTNDGNLVDSRQLAPLPLLGIPGWDARNELPAFYDNVDYFRPGRRGA